MENWDVFISYSSREKKEADEIRNKLEAHNVRCWMAPESIPAGSNYGEHIPIGIRNAKVFLLVISDISQRSPWVAKETSMALSCNKVIIPIVIGKCDLHSPFDFYLSDVQCIEGDEPETTFQKLLTRIREIPGISFEKMSDQQETVVKVKENIQENKKKEEKYQKESIFSILAVVSFVCGCISAVTFSAIALPGVIMGILGLKSKRRKWAITGIVLNSIILLFLLIGFVFLLTY